MIVTAVVCPHPPLLLGALGGAQDPAAELRAVCLRAIGSALAQDPDVVVVVGGAAETRAWDEALPLGVRRFGTTAAPDGEALPQSLAVARRLLDEAGWRGEVRMLTVAWQADAAVVAEVAGKLLADQQRSVLLVLADGSARRGEKAPGHLDERAYPFDDEVARALGEGDAAALTALDSELAAELMVQGRAPYSVLGETVAAQGWPVRARLLYRDDPFGVSYVVAVWEMG